MYTFKGLYIGRLAYSGFVVLTGSTSIVLDPITCYFNRSIRYEEDLVEKTISYLELVPRPIFVLLTSKEYVDIKILEKLQMHYAAKVYASRSSCRLLAENSKILTSLNEVKVGDVVKLGDFIVEVYSGGEESLSYLVRGWGRTIYFAGNQRSRWPKLKVNAVALPIYLYEEEPEIFEEALKNIEYEKIVLSHVDIQRHFCLVRKLKEIYGRKLLVIENFSEFTKI